MDIVIRASIMFLFLFGLLRLMGKRTLGQIAPFEFVSLVVMGDMLQQAVTTQDYSMTAAALAILTFAGWSLALNWLADRSPPARRLLEGQPVVLVQRGELLHANMKAQGVDIDELLSEMRLAGITRVASVDWAILEPQGKFAFVPAEDKGRSDDQDHVL